MKILSPAGNFECLKSAVFNGADEVYLGINQFNARNNIDGFTLLNLEEAVDFAHIYGVKVHLAINILFSNSELLDALNTIVKAYNMGVDAFIIQDLGLAELTHKLYPEIELHASTQMGLHNLEGVQALEKIGFKRVVLSRETPLSEIKRIKENTNVELEYFAQGALCVSFSGNCYMSSYLHGASGNRGKCKQLCRLPYTLERENKKIASGYLLSAKDFNMLDRIDELKKAGIDAIKIEGRARRPYYVATATKIYKNAVSDKKYNINDIELAFNRQYVAGYFDGNGNIISKYNNHIGVKIGKIERVNTGKKFNEVYISSNRKLSAKSTFKTFKNDSEQNTFTAYDLTELSQGKYKLTTTQKLGLGDDLHLIIDYDQEEKVLSATTKRPVDITIDCKSEKEITASYVINGKKHVITGDVLQPAQKQPLTLDEIKNNFSKSEIFDANIIVKTLDKVFIPKQRLNEFRRQVFDNVFCAITSANKHNLPEYSANEFNKIIKYNVKKFTDFQIVENINESFVEKNIVYSPELYNIADVRKFVNKCKKENKNPYLDTPNFALKEDIALLKEIIDDTKISIIANNYYALTFNTNIIIGAGLNVYNNYTARLYDLPIITAESNISTRIYYPYMTMRHCPMKSHLGANCSNCPYKDGYKYVMQSGKVFYLKRKKLNSCTFYLV